MKKAVSSLINDAELPVKETREFVAATRVTRMAFLTVLRDIADTRGEMNELLPKSRYTLQKHDAWLVRGYLEKMLKGAAALAMSLRTEEAHAVLAAADLVVELSRDEELRADMAQAFNDHERMIAEMNRDLAGLSDPERAALRKLLKRVEDGEE